MEVIEPVETCSAARYLKLDPMPQDLIERVISAATRASSPGNSQEWDVIVVRNPETKQKIRIICFDRLERAPITRKRAALGMRALHTVRTTLAVVFAAFALMLGTAHDARGWTTITVNSLADPGGSGICALRDAITAANTKTATNGCAAGNRHDIIEFNVTGTIALASTLPEVTDNQLTINGPASPGITVDGGRNALPGVQGVQVMPVASGATLNLNRLTIANGGSGLLGGGVDNSGTLNVSNSTFSGNQSGYPEGGAIYNAGSLTVTNTTFSGNLAEPFGFGRAGIGGAVANDGTMKITNSTFSGNFALDSGGAIYNAGTLTVTNTTFFGNLTSTAPFPGDGAGIQNFGTLTVTNSTFSGNGGGSGGGISNGSFASLKNTILAMSSGGLDTPPSNCFGTIIDAGYNISDDTSCGFSATGSRNSTNPMLSTAGSANNGGPTETIALDPGSPAIDVIPLASCTDQASPPRRVNTDQRGALRPDLGETVCDIGAYEFQDLAGQPFCAVKSVSALILKFGSIERAVLLLGFPSVKALLNAIRISCGG
jgi:predicted outer membrane repeat protein